MIRARRRKFYRDRIGVADVIIVILLLLLAAVTLYPFLYVVAGSFSDGKDFELGGIWLVPRIFSLDNYRAILLDHRFWRALLNTIIRATIGTACSLLVTSFVAYAMSHPKMPHKKLFRTLNVITMYFSGGLVPFFLVVNLLGLYNNFLVYILPSLYSVYNMIVISRFFKNINESLREAAVIDGANEFQIWWNLYLPMSVPVLITVGIWIAVMHWNSYLPTLLYTDKDESMWTLQYYLMRVIRDASLPDSDVVSPNVTAKTVSFAAMVLSMLPIALVYPFLSRHFHNGAAGASKE